MNRKSLHSRFIRCLSVVLAGSVIVVAGLPEEAEAQVNTKRVLREASGKYKIVRSGGSAKFDDGVNPFTVTPPSMKGTARIPVASTKPVVRLVNSALPADGKATYRGKRTGAKVNRAGSRVAYGSRGTGVEGDNPALYRGTIKGTFTKKGKRWRTSLVMAAVRNQTGTIKTVTGVKIKGGK